MFEKDIYQLIRGLRAHKGNEREYIQESLRECRREIKGSDMDQKSTALLKLVYLEMFGHDMSWASFNVLEVMSSPRYLQKRVGYLAAVQSFRPDTEVLMLAENLLKKDLNSPDKLMISLPLISIPHLVNPSMANSLLTDLLPRLSHSQATIRKKAIMTLYRLALVYPEILRPAWPKIKDRLLDEGEDPSVTAAIVNVVCELGWRRPQDFLPLAPRLFELLTDGGNNWMAIKIIKTFSVLTPLEPRLVKKLLPPLTSIIKTTPAMSLLYECINGIIQGGIMEAAGGTTEGDEIARLCVNKLRAMLVVEGDPNLRYVALLAFAKITSSHADLVSQHQDVILECIDDADISIRTRALDLVAGMVNANNLQTVVERLIRQLCNGGHASVVNEPSNDRANHNTTIPMSEYDDDDDERPQSTIRLKENNSNQAPSLPDDYRSSVIERILQMCSQDTYSNMIDFEWYIGVLFDLVKQCPATTATGRFGSHAKFAMEEQPTVSDAIGSELLNVAVRVKAVRPEATAAAQSLLLIERRSSLFPTGTSKGQGVLAAAAFITGEFAAMLSDPEAVLLSLLHESGTQLQAPVLKCYLQAIPKVYAVLTGDPTHSWTAARRSQVELHTARVIQFLESLVLHPSLEVQERAVEYLDLMRLAAEAITSHNSGDEGYAYTEPPLLLTQAIPALFAGQELNPVAPAALRKVPWPSELGLDDPINPNLQMLLLQADYDLHFEEMNEEVYQYYNEKPSNFASGVQKPASDFLEPVSDSMRTRSYQGSDEDTIDQATIERRKAERRERYKDDPYYIEPEQTSRTSTPLHGVLRGANGDGVDVDAIPVMELKLDHQEAATVQPRPIHAVKATQKRARKHFEIAADETLDVPENGVLAEALHNAASLTALSSSPASVSLGARAGKKSVLEVDSSGLSSLSLAEEPAGGGTSRQRNTAHSKLDAERRLAEEEEMARAVQHVERLRLEMQRAEERVHSRDDIPEDGTVVRRKNKKKARVAPVGEIPHAHDGKSGVSDQTQQATAKKKKKRREVGTSDTASARRTGDGFEDSPSTVGAIKKKKKRQIVLEDS